MESSHDKQGGFQVDPSTPSAPVGHAENPIVLGGSPVDREADITMASLASLDISQGPSNTLRTGLTSTLDEASVEAGLQRAAAVLDEFGGNVSSSPVSRTSSRPSRSPSPACPDDVSPIPAAVSPFPEFPDPVPALVPPPPPPIFQVAVNNNVGDVDPENQVRRHTLHY